MPTPMRLPGLDVLQREPTLQLPQRWRTHMCQWGSLLVLLEFELMGVPHDDRRRDRRCNLDLDME